MFTVYWLNEWFLLRRGISRRRDEHSLRIRNSVQADKADDEFSDSAGVRVGNWIWEARADEEDDLGVSVSNNKISDRIKR